jgi:hypothetical protein
MIGRAASKGRLFDDALPFGEDFDMWVRLAREFSSNIVRNPRIYRVTTSNFRPITRRLSGVKDFEKYGVLLHDNDTPDSTAIWDAHCYSGNIGKGRGHC